MFTVLAPQQVVAKSGRVIHNSRSIGFTGWTGGVAVFNQALSAEELGRLAAICRNVVTAK